MTPWNRYKRMIIVPTFDTPGPIAATLVVAGAQVRVTASDRTDTVVLVEPIDKASKKDLKVANKTTLSNNQFSCPNLSSFTFQPSSTLGDTTRTNIGPAQHYTAPASFACSAKSTRI